MMLGHSFVEGLEAEKLFLILQTLSEFVGFSFGQTEHDQAYLSGDISCFQNKRTIGRLHSGPCSR